MAERSAVGCKHNECDEQSEENWFNEGEAVIADVKQFVASIGLSKKLQSNKDCVYFNIETKESNKYCIEMSVRGFRICGEEFDENSDQFDSQSFYFETINALLDNVSPEYRLSFSAAIIEKLKQIEKKE